MKVSPQRLFPPLLWSASAISVVSFLALLFWFLPGAIPSGHTSGVWAALANDLAHGIFYRPLFDADGYYGGTRYMPLFFSLYGGLIYLFKDPVTTGFCLSLGSAVLLLAGVRTLLHTWKVRASLSLAFTLLIPASIAFQLLSLEVRGDFLAGALTIWGIVFACRFLEEKHTRWMGWSSLAFTGAFFTKFTSIGGIIAVFIYLVLKKEYNPARKFLLSTGLLILALLFLVDLASHGKALESFRACAVGGFNWAYALKAPWWFFRISVIDPFFLMIFCFALFLLYKTRENSRDSFPSIYFWVTLLITVGIFTAPGTDHNHLVDLQAAAILLIGYHNSRADTLEKFYNLFFGIMILAITFTLIPGTISVREKMEPLGKPTRKMVKEILNRLGPDTRNLLSENPLVPILNGERPLMLDSFTLRLLSLKYPEIHRDFREKMQSGYFGAIILLDYSGAPLDRLQQAIENHSSYGVKRFFGGAHFPPDFLTLLKNNYFLSFVIRPYVIYQPKRIQKE